MHRIIAICRKLSISSLALVIGGYSALSTGVAVYADSADCTPPSNSTENGVRWPVGADAATFTYQCTGLYTGKWTNTYYMYDPTTNTRSPLYNPSYTYDCNSDTWTRVDWEYSPAAGAYQESRIETSDPGLPTDCPLPPSDQATPAQSSASTNNPPSPISNTGANSGNSTGSSITDNNTSQNTTNADMTNAVSSNTSTGSASVLNNVTGGAATSGNATDITNVANLLQSTSNVFGSNTVMFAADINGDVNGDILLDPSTILNTGPGSSNTAAGNLQLNTSNANSTDASINNNVNVKAQTGDATVANNTTGGNATSGNAEAIANLMNVINSTVEAGKSFIGTININGDLNGNILLPQGLIDQLLASTGNGSSNTTTNNLTDSSTATNNVTETINNSLTSEATTGNASVSSNTTGGNATSGNAATNVTLLNLTGNNVVAANDLLVFVNVLGKWYGVIMNAPAGITAAELGGAVSQTGSSAGNAVEASASLNRSTTNTANLAINNNVNVKAQTGDATVANNTTGGNATSGNAATAINLLNIEGSNLSLSNWFGVLFINVFGVWNGNFGIANPVALSATDATSTSAANENVIQQSTQQALRDSLHQFATFIASDPSTSLPSSDPNLNAVLGDYTAAPVAKEVSRSTASPTANDGTHGSYLPALGLIVAGCFLAISEHERFFRRNKS